MGGWVGEVALPRSNPQTHQIKEDPNMLPFGGFKLVLVFLGVFSCTSHEGVDPTHSRPQP